jgi:hypothetical protein
MNAIVNDRNVWLWLLKELLTVEVEPGPAASSLRRMPGAAGHVSFKSEPGHVTRRGGRTLQGGKTVCPKFIIAAFIGARVYPVILCGGQSLS